MKNDQEGQNAYPRHIYANPDNPAICPILSLALVVFTRFTRNGSSRLLFSEKSQDRFSEWLKRTCTSNEELLLAMGSVLDEIGTHSFRKGVATALSSNPGGPSAIAIWLRAGWSLGPVPSRYIFQGSGGDQFAGRAATGLDVNDYKFGVLPPHFNEKEGSVLTVDEWEIILPGYIDFFPDSFKVALPFLLA